MYHTLLSGRKGDTLGFSLTPHLQKTICLLSLSYTLTHTHTHSEVNQEAGIWQASSISISRAVIHSQNSLGGQPSYNVEIASLKTGHMKTLQREFQIPPSNSCF